MSRKRVIAIGLIAFGCFVAEFAFRFFLPNSYVRVENILRDHLAQNGRKTPPNSDLIFLAIDADSVGLEESADIGELYGLTNSHGTEARALRLMSKLWPWPREVYGLVLERLVKAGARVVLFDLTFPTSTEGDEPFRLALDSYKDRVVIGSNFISGSSRDFITVGAAHTRPPESLVRQTTPMDDRVGYTNFWPDEDDVVRRAQFRVTFEQVEGVAPENGSERFLSLAARGLQKAGFAKHIPEGISDRIFRFTAPPRQGFRAHSIFEIFVPEYWERNYKAGESFRDKIVLIGAEGNWQHDEHATPFGSMPGPELHLNAINAALHGEFLRETPPAGVLGVALLAGAVAVALSLRIRSPLLRVAALGASDFAYGWLALQSFNFLNLFLPCGAPFIELNATVLLGLVVDFTWERFEKMRVRHMLEKYVSSNVVSELLDNPKPFQRALGGVIKPAAILFSDIRGYSLVSARTDPRELVAQLNEYLGAMVECVFRYNGTLDKFIGDAVMAVWGNVQSEGAANDAANAVRAGLAMREALRRLNFAWRTRGLPELRIGIAINQGDVVVGNIGSPRRMEFTVIGDAVNVSWKLQELTKQVGSEIIVSNSVAALVLEHFELQPLGHFQITGFADSVEIFGVCRPIAVGAEQDLAAFEVR